MKARRTVDATAVRSASLASVVGNRAFGRLLSSPTALVEAELAQPGRPLDLETRRRMEAAFGADLGAVRVHDNASAALAARALNTRGFARGAHVVLDLGPGGHRSGDGQRLLAHELAHVIQQRLGGGRAAGLAPGSSAEAEAGAAAKAVTGGGQAQGLTGAAVGVARAAPAEQISQLSDDELAAEHGAIRDWLLHHGSSDPAYADNLAYFQGLEQEVSSRNPATAAPAAASSSSAPAAEEAGWPPPAGALPSEELNYTAAAPAPSAAAAPAGELSYTPAAPASSQAVPPNPEDMVTHVLNQRGWLANAPGTLNEPGQGLGTGFSTNSMIQVVDGEGNQVATEWSRYGGRGDPHAETQALDALRQRLGGKQIPGGKLIVAVDQNTCGGCTERIRAFARDHGLETIEVWGPARGRVRAPGIPVSTKTAGRTAYSGIEGAPPSTAQLLWGETVSPAPAGPAPGAAAPPSGAPPAAEPLFTPAPPPEKAFTPAKPPVGELAGEEGMAARVAPPSEGQVGAPRVGGAQLEEIPPEVRFRASLAADNLAVEFKAMRVARGITVGLAVIQAIGDIMMFEHFTSMAESGLKGQGFILTKELAQARALESSTRDWQTAYNEFSGRLTAEQPDLLAALRDPVSAGRATGHVGTLALTLEDQQRQLAGRMGRVDAALREATAKERATQKILDDPRPIIELNPVMADSMLADIYAAHEDWIQISSSLQAVSQNLHAVDDVLSGDLQFLRGWEVWLFDRCLKGGACGERQVQIPFVGPSTFRFLPGE